MKPLIKAVYREVMAKSFSASVLNKLCAVKLNKLAVWYAKAALDQSMARVDHQLDKMNQARLYVAYSDMAPGREAHEILSSKSWTYSLWHLRGEVHPAIMYEMCLDHPTKYPLEKLALDWIIFKYHAKEFIHKHWLTALAYTQLLIIGNLV